MMNSQTKLVTVTPKAAEKVREFITNEKKEGNGLRIYVAGGGCSGFSYGLSLENEPSEEDAVIESDGVRIYVDPASAQYLKGCEVDYVDDLMNAGFKINNPNVTSTCACGHSQSY